MSAVVVAIYRMQLEHYLVVMQNAHLPDAVLQQVRATSDAMAAAPIPQSATGTMANAIRDAMNQSFVYAIRVAALTGAAMAAASSVIAAVTIGGKPNKANIA
jgi:hypothetical protein